MKYAGILLAVCLLQACGDDTPSDECTQGETIESDDERTYSICTCTAEDPSSACTQGEEGCTCEMTEIDISCGEPQLCPEETSVDPYRFVIIEDLTTSSSGTSPGVELDAVVITRADGTVLPAAIVEDFLISDRSNEFQNPNDILGLPDSNCELQNIVALGGREAGGYIIVGFENADDTGLFRAGDSITVYELGSTMCPSSDYDDDPYKVSVAISKNAVAFTEIATDVTGNHPIVIPEALESQSQGLHEQGLSCACIPRE